MNVGVVIEENDAAYKITKGDFETDKVILKKGVLLMVVVPESRAGTINESIVLEPKGTGFESSEWAS
ncbi:hypothetical protein EVAR_28963_1 [Eumeta japonica]|uniref:Uncharacterized protein n=1 Tax=Eumeta variegata TaxID=151549 RepID=A0A4C1W115_EUMVA|nr:hypothetical protein EVAR_28963_1 [Eumeta japonica]